MQGYAALVRSSGSPYAAAAGLASAASKTFTAFCMSSIVLMENRLYDPDMATYRKGFSVWAGVQWAW